MHSKVLLFSEKGLSFFRGAGVTVGMNPFNLSNTQLSRDTTEPSKVNLVTGTQDSSTYPLQPLPASYAGPSLRGQARKNTGAAALRIFKTQTERVAVMLAQDRVYI